MTRSAPYGIAVLGTGIMGHRMLAALEPHPRFRVAVLWDPDPRALSAARAAAPGARAATGLDDAVGDPAVDLVYVAAPPAAHLDGVRAAVAAGRACLCEKPLASDVGAAEALRDLVLRSGLPFAVNFPFAGSAGARGFVDVVRSGDLGALRSASITLRFAQWPRPWQAGARGWLSGAAEGGFTREVLSHFVFLAERTFGPATVADVALERVHGHAETALRARLVHAGVDLLIDAAVAGDVADHNRFAVTGADGMVALTDWSRLTIDGLATDRAAATPSTLDRLASMLDGRTDHDLASVDEGLAVVRTIEALLTD